MELEHLRTFIAVAELGSMSASAKYLNLSVSSVSAHIKSLEVAWDVQLFARTSRGVELTEKGQLLAQHAQVTIQSADKLSQVAESLRGQVVGTMRLGVSVAPDSFSVVDMLGCLKLEHPELTIHLMQSETAKIIHDIQQDRLDVGVVYGTVDADKLMAHQLKMVELVLVMPEAWRGKTDGSWQSIGQLAWIHTGDDCPFQVHIDKLCQSHAIQPAQFIRTDDDRTRRELVIAGMGLSLLDISQATHTNISILDAPSMLCAVSLVYSAHRQFDPLIQAIRKQVVRG